MELRTENWKEFKLTQLFDIETCKGLDTINIDLVDKERDDYIYEFIGRTNTEYGLQGFIQKQDFSFNEAGSITISQVGTITAQYRYFDYYTSQNIFKLTPLVNDLNKKHMLFLVCAINKKLLEYTGYSSFPTIKSLQKKYILLPEKDGEPDWPFMEEYISFIENRYIDKIEENNKEKIRLAMEVTGITEEELDGELVVEEPERVEEFRVGDLFDVHKIKGINQEHLTDYTEEECYNYITRTSLNNGVHSMTGKVKSAALQNKNTFSLGLLGMDFFYQRKPWYAGQFVRCITPKFEINNALATYFSVILNKRSELYKNDLIRDFDSIFSNDTVSLPAIDDLTPDFEYMENVIYIYILRLRLRIGNWLEKKRLG